MDEEPIRPRDWSQLAAAARTGDNEALGEICAQVRNYLCLMVQQQLASDLGPKVDASDIAQDTLLEACRDFKTFRGETEQEFRAWLCRLVHHNIIDSSRRYRSTQCRDTQRETTLEAPAVPQLSANLKSASSILRRKETDEELLRAVATLPERERTVIELRHRHGCNYREIAERLSISEVAVRQIWSRSIKQLRSQLSRNYAPPAAPE